MLRGHSHGWRCSDPAPREGTVRLHPARPHASAPERLRRAAPHHAAPRRITEADVHHDRRRGRIAAVHRSHRGGGRAAETVRSGDTAGARHAAGSLMTHVERFESFIEPQALARILAAMAEASGGAANVYGDQDVGRINPLMRRTTQLTVPDEITQYVISRLSAHASILEERFGTEPLFVEPPQFLKYGDRKSVV